MLLRKLDNKSFEMIGNLKELTFIEVAVALRRLHLEDALIMLEQNGDVSNDKREEMKRQIDVGRHIESRICTFFVKEDLCNLENSLILGD